ncbi:MAG: DMT family transporter [Actinomycetota bacterium]|nr:DMT family transporter [Actinomycetota bacterium]
MVGTVVAVGIGAAVAVQARINGELGQRIDDGVVAALLSFLGGLLLLILLTAARPAMRRGLGRVITAVRRQTLRPYQLLGGICGAFLVACQGLTVATIGVAVFTVAVVAGQTVSGLLVDRAGVGPGEPRPVSPRRIAGAILALAAVVLAVSDRLSASQALWLALLPALAGVGTAWQQAVNGRVGAAARDGGPALAGMLPAAMVNFGVGTVALALVTGVEVAIRGLPEPLPTQPWLYLGGALGVLFIGAAAVIVPITGVLLLGLGTVAGQLIGALLLDLFLPADGDRLTAITLIGTALTLVAVTVIALPSRSAASRSSV